jgi:hypothetical protein
MHPASAYALGLALLVASQAPAEEPNVITAGEEGLPEPNGVFIWADVPAEVTVGDTLTVRILIRNRSERDKYVFEDIDIGSQYLRGFDILRITPDPDEFDDSDDYVTLTYDLEVPPMEKREILIELRAREIGLYSADLEVWSADEDKCSTRRLQTEVVAAQ